MNTDKLVYVCLPFLFLVVIGNHEGMFYFHPPTTMTLSSLHYRRPLDFEQKQVHNLTITLQNMEYDGLLGLVIEHITVRVVARNEHVPKFTGDSNVLTVKENTPVGTSIERFNVTDLDSNDKLVFSLAQTPDNEFFHIDENTGELIVARSLDYEEIREIFLILVVEDGLYSSFKEISIKIQNENDNHPFFTKERYLLNVTETVMPGSPLLKMDVNDLDFDEVRLEITDGNEENLFGVAETNIIVKEKLVAGRKYVLKIVAYDKENLRSLNETLVKVDVIRDSSKYTTTRAPYLKVFREDFYDVLILESIKVGTVIHRFQPYSVSDLLTFRLKEIGNFQKSSFKITDEGSIVLSSKLDLREISTHYLVISACASNAKEICELCQVTINVKPDPNDWPRFQKKRYAASISESSKPGDLLQVLKMRGRLKTGVKFKVVDDVYHQTYLKKGKQNAKLYLNSTLNHTLQQTFQLSVVMYREPNDTIIVTIDRCTVEVQVLKAGLHGGNVVTVYSDQEDSFLNWKYLVLLVSLILILVLLLVVCVLLKQSKR